MSDGGMELTKEQICNCGHGSEHYVLDIEGHVRAVTDRYRDALVEYGRHIDPCPLNNRWRGKTPPCTCGLIEALKGDESGA